MIKYLLVLSVCTLAAVQDTSNLMVFLDAKLADKAESSFSLVDDPALVSQYETVRLLRVVQGQLAKMNEQLSVITGMYTEQYKQSQIPLSTRVFDTVASCICSVRQTYPVRMLESSSALQCVLGGFVFFGTLNFRLLQLQRAYYAARDDSQKQQCKKSYQSIVRYIQAVIGVEKMITARLRDASIGFWGNGSFAKRFFGAVCDWCSLRTLFYIDEQLASPNV